MKPQAMIATSQPLAVSAALDVLKSGGNAVDAAVCAVAMLGVVEPMSTGIGGDCFAIVYEAKTGKLHGLNGSGRAPKAASIQDVHLAGHCAMPEAGILSVTVPGALHAWQSLLDRFGSRTLSQLLQPAIRAAHDGFSVTPIIARDWAGQAGALVRGVNTHTFLPDGRAPQAGEVFRQPELARSLQFIADQGIGAFYQGVLGQTIVMQSNRLGGWLSMDDLAEHSSIWVEPINTEYRGCIIHELPPNGQGVIVLEALNLLQGFPLAGMAEADRMHTQIEAIKLAFVDAWRYVADPDVADVPVPGLLSKEYTTQRRALIGAQALQSPTHGFPPSGTVYVTVVDQDGNAVSLINSLYEHFGAKVAVERTGILLQNRGALFSLDPSHPNALAPSKRPYHTIIPAMVCRDGKPWL
ncbi:MAG TPA: gamma-glutamyltransferase family protein, partial [Candidatus Bipolaricaulota bacterium]